MPACRSLGQRMSTRSTRSTPYSAVDSLEEDQSDLSSLRTTPSVACDEEELSASVVTRAGAKTASKTTRKPAKPREKPTLPYVIIGGVKLTPTLLFDTFWYWIAERKNMYDKRRRGEPAPWTEDRILQKWSFCNSYRVLDKICQFIITDVIQKGPQDTIELVFRVLLFEIFTNIGTWKALESALGPLRWSTYNRDAYEAVLGPMKDAKITLYTSAYIKPAPLFRAGRDNYQNHLDLLENMMENELPMKLAGAQSLADVYEYIISFPGMGSFNTYQLMLNLSYTNILNFHPNDFVVAGPGAQSGLVKLFGTSMRHALEEDKDFAITALRWLLDNQEEQFTRLGLDFERLGPNQLPLDISDIEHAVCEADKYSRERYPFIQGIGNRKNIKTKFKQTTMTFPAQAVLPEAWSHPSRKIPRIRKGKLHVEKRYEIRKIGKHRMAEVEEGEAPEREFLVFWEGYRDSEASWSLESTLRQDAPVILDEYLASIEERPQKQHKSRAKGKSNQ